VGAAITPFNGSTSSVVTIPGGSTFIALSPGATGYAVGSSNGSLFKVLNSASTQTSYNIVVVGA